MHTIAVTTLCDILRHSQTPESLTCPQLNSGMFLTKKECLNSLLGNRKYCCGSCSPGSDDPISLSTFNDSKRVLRHEYLLPKHMYLWAKLHHSDEYSWTRASALDQSFWGSWACLTQRTRHVTTDADPRGLCGLLYPQELPAFIEQLSRIHIPTNEDDELDMFEAEVQFKSLMEIRSMAHRCVEANRGLAWVHDGVI